VSSRRRGKSAQQHEEHHVDERWMASYMDMVTVLMCTFIVLFSMSTVNVHKYDELKNSLQTGFGLKTTAKIDTVQGVIVPPKVKTTTKPMPTPIVLAEQEVQDFQKLQATITQRLAAKGLAQDVKFTIDSRGLTVGLVGDQTFFNSNQATLTTTATNIINIIGPVLQPTPYKISIEGHADRRPPAAPFATNWDLAAERSVSVLRQLVEHDSITDTRISAVSYGSAQATAAGTDAASLSQDRRVDIVVLSAQVDSVRSLIPQVVAAEKRK